MKYSDFIAGKHVAAPEVGFTPLPMAAPLFPFQAANVAWAVRKGRAALLCDTGLGKTIQQLEWARQVAEHTAHPVLILAPLAVSQQTVREGAKFGIPVRYARDQAECDGAGIVITNYERLDRFDTAGLAGVVLDESSILKSYSGTLKNAIFRAFERTPYKLACTATPAPNDHLELGNHAEFLGVMSSHEMIARWFINDTSQFGTYRLKGHASEAFWDWVSTWAVMASLPSDVGPYEDAGYVLPELRTGLSMVDVDVEVDRGTGRLFRMVDLNATSVHAEKRRTAAARAARVAEIVAREPNEAWLIWCETDYEADVLNAAIPTAEEVRGSDSLEKKERLLMGFVEGTVRVLVTKPKLAGFGLNFQHCARVAFAGATFSFEAYYQAIRRTWRFGQLRPVHVHVVMARTETGVWDVLCQKRDAFEVMKGGMLAAARRARAAAVEPGTYVPTKLGHLPTWLVSCDRGRDAP